jgi:hypothetical protein
MAAKRDLAVALPPIFVNQVSAENHAYVIKFKPLGRTHAPHLIDPVGVGGPASGIAFHGMLSPSSYTSSTNWPELSGLDHGQQNPATRRALCRRR